MSVTTGPILHPRPSRPRVVRVAGGNDLDDSRTGCVISGTSCVIRNDAGIWLCIGDRCSNAFVPALARRNRRTREAWRDIDCGVLHANEWPSSLWDRHYWRVVAAESDPDMVPVTTLVPGLDPETVAPPWMKKELTVFCVMRQ